MSVLKLQCLRCGIRKVQKGCPQTRGSPDMEQVTYSSQLAGGKPAQEHQVLESWAPAPPQVAAEIRQAAKQNQITYFNLWRGINENYWACRGAGYQEKHTQPPVLVGATRQREPGNQMSTDKQLSNPSSHFQFTSLKPSAFNNLHTGELKAEQRIHVPQCRDLPKPGRCHDLLPA